MGTSCVPAGAGARRRRPKTPASDHRTVASQQNWALPEIWQVPKLRGRGELPGWGCLCLGAWGKNVEITKAARLQGLMCVGLLWVLLAAYCEGLRAAAMGHGRPAFCFGFVGVLGWLAAQPWGEMGHAWGTGLRPGGCPVSCAARMLRACCAMLCHPITRQTRSSCRPQHHPTQCGPWRHAWPPCESHSGAGGW